VLSPGQALQYLEQVLEKEPRTTVAGIAGPGDPLANREVTMETLSLIRQRFPDLILCLATNGLELVSNLERLAELKVSHITLTINAVDPGVGEKMYAWIRDGRRVYRGLAAAGFLLDRQLEAIVKLKEKGFTVKVNTIVVQGKNDHHVIDVARRMAELRVDIFNCMPMYPSPVTLFEDIPEPPLEMMSRLRQEAEKYIPQLHHCTRCRADAAGLLDEDRTEEFRGCLTACSALPVHPEENRPYVAVASQEGMLVNMHLGEAKSFLIYGRIDKGNPMDEGGRSKEEFRLIETRSAPEPGRGEARWQALAQILKDCRAVLVSGIGDNPRAILEKSGIRPVEMYGFIEDGLLVIFKYGDINADINGDTMSRTWGLKTRRPGCANGAGCARSNVPG
jgi:nitrogen fixation protein NifB